MTTQSDLDAIRSLTELEEVVEAITRDLVRVLDYDGPDYVDPDDSWHDAQDSYDRQVYGA